MRPLLDAFPFPGSFRSVRRGLASCGRIVNDLIFPWSCMLCDRESPELCGPLCSSCRTTLLDEATRTGASACPRCALPASPYADAVKGCAWCKGKSLGFDAAIALAPYDGTIRDLCLRFKHERDACLGPLLAGLLAEARRDELARAVHDAWIVPVPMHWRRWLQRGYNQADALARGLGAEVDRPVLAALRRVKAAEHLVSKNAAERTKAMRGAFQAKARADLKGRTILLVDDILTTGATCGAAARALKQAGAKRVVVAVAARTP